jgi:hypothetical protein
MTVRFRFFRRAALHPAAQLIAATIFAAAIALAYPIGDMPHMTPRTRLLNCPSAAESHSRANGFVSVVHNLSSDPQHLVASRAATTMGCGCRFESLAASGHEIQKLYRATDCEEATFAIA